MSEKPKLWTIAVAGFALLALAGVLARQANEAAVSRNPTPPAVASGDVRSLVADITPTPSASSTPLDPVQGQQARFEGCSSRMKHYMDMGVWVNGGARPGVDRSAWNQLTDSEQSEIFDIAACLAVGGKTGERMVTVTGQGGFPEIETRRVANARAFATR